MRTDDNCKFKLHKTATRDWYEAEEVDARIAELEQQLAEAKRVNLGQRVEDVCLGTMGDYSDYEGLPFHLLSIAFCLYPKIDRIKYNSKMTKDEFVNWLIEQGVEREDL